MEQALTLIADAKRTKATRLDLGNCGLTELPDALFELIWLEELILSTGWYEYNFEKKEWETITSENKGEANRIQHLSHKLGLLKSVKKLVVAGKYDAKWDLSDLAPLKELTNLQQLYVHSTQVSDLAPLKELTNLQLLSVYSTKVSDLSPLKELANLQILDVSSTKVSDLAPLNKLANLQQLEVYSTKVSDLAPLNELANLQILDVSSTKVSDLAPLNKLANLQQLYVHSTQVSDLAPLKELANLQQLSVHSTQVSDLAPLKELTNLQILDVSFTQVSDLAPLKELTNLQILDVSFTQVSDLAPLKELANLQQFYLSSTQVSDLAPLKELTNLQLLSVYSTKVSDLAPLKELANLQQLDVSSTQVSDLAPLKELANLQLLSVFSNQVSDLSPLKDLIRKGLPVKRSNPTSWKDTGIYVNDCPLDKALIASIKKGHKAVLHYFEQPKVPLYEARVLVLGEPRAGKTTLRRKLKNHKAPMPTQQESTKAFEVEIEPYKCHVEKEGEKNLLTYHLWDFGGQDYYRLLHQLFVAEQSVYVIVTDTDRNKNEEEIDFWLETIQRLGRDKNGRYGPVLLLQNPKTNREGSDFPDLKKRYPFWQQNERFVINLNALAENTEAFDKQELEQFKRFKATLERSFCQLDHIGKQMPANWVRVRKALARHEKDNWITTEQFYTICTDQGIRDKEEKTDLLDIFHMLGYVLHYKNTALQGMVVLRREWVTDALYRVLDDAIVNKNKGWFRQEDAEKIWYEPQYENRTRELLALMQEFKLSYLNESSKKHIVPAKLPEDMEDLPDWDTTQNVSLHLQYDWLPRAVPIQLIVTLHDNLVELEHGEQWIWRRGAVLDGRKLDLKNVQVRILENWRDSKIEISAKGEHSEVLIRTIMAAWRKVNEPFEDKVIVQKQILCACETCQKAARPFVFEYEDVLNAIEAADKLYCNKSRQGFLAASILKGLFDQSTVALDIFEKRGHGLDKELYDLIAEGNLEKALEKLSENGDNEWTVDLKRRYNKLKAAQIKNLIPFDEQSQEESRIVNDLLAYLNNSRDLGTGFFGRVRRVDRAEWFETPGKQGIVFKPVFNINVRNDNKNLNVQKTDPALSKEVAELKEMLAQLNAEARTKLKDFVETLPEPEDEAEKASTGKQILKWLNKNAEGIAVNVAASGYYDGLKFLFGIG
jgi:Leucine-rich repeat (LRR) protein/GTPase SAR1 family protein